MNTIIHWILCLSICAIGEVAAKAEEPIPIAIKVALDSGGGVNYLDFSKKKDSGVLTSEAGDSLVVKVEHIYILKKVTDEHAVVEIQLKISRKGDPVIQEWHEVATVPTGRDANFEPSKDVKLSLTYGKEIDPKKRK